jgi:hypothetical protein
VAGQGLLLDVPTLALPADAWAYWMGLVFQQCHFLDGKKRADSRPVGVA